MKEKKYLFKKDGFYLTAFYEALIPENADLKDLDNRTVNLLYAGDLYLMNVSVCASSERDGVHIAKYEHKDVVCEELEDFDLSEAISEVVKLAKEMELNSAKQDSIVVSLVHFPSNHGSKVYSFENSEAGLKLAKEKFLELLPIGNHHHFVYLNIKDGLEDFYFYKQSFDNNLGMVLSIKKTQ